MKRSFFWTFIFVLILWSCEKEPPVFPEVQSPVVTFWDVPEELNIASIEPELIQVKVRDPQGLENLAEVNLFMTQGENSVAQAQMWDDGTNGDIIAGNGTFTYQFVPSELPLNEGELVVLCQAVDRESNKSEPVRDTLMVKKLAENHPPQILEVVAPDTISRSQGGLYLLTATVSDPDGLSDIQKVTLNSYKPDGTPASGNPFSLYDTGEDGDARAGDGIYSFQFGISATNALGVYRFEIQAQDKSGAKSNQVTHYITVIE